jgi:sulfur-carrier protein
MKVHIQLYATLARHLPESREGNSCTLEVSEGTLIGDLLTVLKIPTHAPKIILRNGVHADLTTMLTNGDRVAVFPPIAGG